MSDAAVRKQTLVDDARSAAPKGHAGYAVYDPVGQKIGTAERVFVNPDGEPAYIRVRMGFFGTRLVLIPVQFVETDEEKKTLVLK
jgi:PRC-barrel domain